MKDVSPHAKKVENSLPGERHYGSQTGHHGAIVSESVRSARSEAWERCTTAQPLTKSQFTSEKATGAKPYKSHPTSKHHATVSRSD